LRKIKKKIVCSFSYVESGFKKIGVSNGNCLRRGTNYRVEGERRG
jgi:hypothetical protein